MSLHPRVPAPAPCPWTTLSTEDAGLLRPSCTPTGVPGSLSWGACRLGSFARPALLVLEAPSLVGTPTTTDACLVWSLPAPVLRGEEDGEGGGTEGAASILRPGKRRRTEECGGGRGEGEVDSGPSGAVASQLSDAVQACVAQAQDQFRALATSVRLELCCGCMRLCEGRRSALNIALPPRVALSPDLIATNQRNLG